MKKEQLTSKNQEVHLMARKIQYFTFVGRSYLNTYVQV